MLEYLLQKGADVNYQEQADGSTLAMKMAGYWEFETVLEYNVDFMLADDLGRRVIDYVVKNSKRSDENSQYQLIKRLEPDALRASTLSWTSKNAVLMMKDIWLSLPENQWKEISPYLLEALRGNTEYLVEHYDKWLTACKDDPQAVRAIYAAFAFCDDDICDLDFASYGSNSQFLKCALTAGNWKNAEKMIQKTAPEEISMSRYLRELIEYGAPVEVMDWMKEKGYEAMINDYVLLAGAQCSKDWCEKLLEECVDERDEVIVGAADLLFIRNDPETAFALLERVETLSDESVKNLLYSAATSDDIKILEWLENRGICWWELDCADIFTFAVTEGSENVAIYLLNAELDCTNETVQSAMKDATFQGEHKLLKAMVEKGMPIDNRTVCQAARSATETLKLVLEYGGDADAPISGDWNTPLAYAVACGSIDNVKLLLEHGADPKKTDLEKTMKETLKICPFLESRFNEINEILSADEPAG